MTAADTSTEQIRTLLAFEAAHPKPSGRKDAQIRAELHISPTVYWAKLDAATRDPDSYTIDPTTAARVRRAIDAAAQARAERRTR